MTLSVTLRSRAEADIAQAYAWYELQRPGLGDAFLRSIEAAFARIARRPDANPVVHDRVRRASLQRFPYGVFYVVRAERLDVLAVYHARRRPRIFAP